MENGKENKPSYLEIIEKYIKEIDYGTVSIVIHDGKVVQIERNEKYRIKN